jgi:hypothetical protein
VWWHEEGEEMSLKALSSMRRAHEMQLNSKVIVAIKNAVFILLVGKVGSLK